MEKARCNILVWGLLSTGSSALIDILREYDNIHFIPGEFDDFRAPGRIADQLVLPKSENFNRINNITGFKSKYTLILKLIKKIIRGEIKTGKVLLNQLLTIQMRFNQLSLLQRLNEQLTPEISLDEKIGFVSNWINEIGNFKNENKDFVLYNQPLTPSIETKIWKQVFSPFKFICVYRDPKDQIAEIIRNGALYAPFGAPWMNHGGLALESIYGRSRKSAIQIHVEAIKKRMEWIDHLRSELDPEMFLMIDFEGLILNYSKYRNILENFIGNIKPNPAMFKQYFNPEIAKKKIGIYREFISEDELLTIMPLEKWYLRNISTNLKG